MIKSQTIGLILTYLAPTIAAFAAMIASIRNGRKAQEIHVLLNSRLDVMMKEIKKAAFAAGVKHEKARFLREKK